MCMILKRKCYCVEGNTIRHRLFVITSMLDNNETLEDILSHIHRSSEILSQSRDVSDDVESVLTWLNPNEPASNHQGAPPTLRLKNSFKRLLPYPNNNNHNDIKNEIQLWLGQYYIYQVRLHFFANIKSIKTFKDVENCLNYYLSPLKYVPIFSDQEGIEDIYNLRRYLINSTPELKEHLIRLVNVTIEEENYDEAYILINGLRDIDSYISVTDLVMNGLVKKIIKLCRDRMRRRWNVRYLIMETYNEFISDYWIQFAKLLNCAKDDHSMTGIIFKCFEKEFIEIRKEEFFEICVYGYPDSKPTLLELRHLISNENSLQELAINFLKEFERIILTPIINTMRSLLAYIRMVKSLIILDPSCRYLNFISKFIDQQFREKKNLGIIMLYLILEIPKEELERVIYPIKVNDKIMNEIIKELKDPEFGINEVSGGEDETKKKKKKNIIMSPIFKKINKELPDYLKDENEEDKIEHKNEELENGMSFEKVMREYLMWLPEPNDMTLVNNTNKISSNSNLLDILMNIFESKEYILNIFIELLSYKLINEYELNKKWENCLKLFKDKFKFEIINNENIIINNMIIMLNDIKNSKKFNKDNEINIKGKYLTSAYWQYNIEEEKQEDIISEDEYDINEELLMVLYREVIGKYKYVYEGRKLQLWPNKSKISMDIEFDDGRVIDLCVTFDQYTILMLIYETPKIKEDRLMRYGRMKKERVDRIIKYLLDKKVIYRDENGCYEILEVLKQEEQEENKQEKRKVPSSVKKIEDRRDVNKWLIKRWITIERELILKSKKKNQDKLEVDITRVTELFVKQQEDIPCELSTDNINTFIRFQAQDPNSRLIIHMR